MTNLEKLQRLVQFFASCDWDHNDNRVVIEAYDNGWNVGIEFSGWYREDLLVLDRTYTRLGGTLGNPFTIGWKDHGGTLEAFTNDFQRLDDLLGEIFTHVVKTDLETISLNTEKNSQ